MPRAKQRGVKPKPRKPKNLSKAAIAAGGKPRIKRRYHKNKDPKRPKRAMSSFMFFANANREIVKEQNPELNFFDIAKELGVRWKEMEPQDKRPYEDLAEQDKKRYNDEKANYVPDPAYDRPPLDTTQRKPKKARSAFLLFSNSERPSVKESHPDFSFSETAKELGRRWKSLSASQKKPWEKASKLDQKRYEEEMSNYNPNAPAAESKRPPYKPKISAFTLFCQNNLKRVRKLHPNATAEVLATKLCAKWRKVSTGVKNSMDEKAKNALSASGASKELLDKLQITMPDRLFKLSQTGTIQMKQGKYWVTVCRHGTKRSRCTNGCNMFPGQKK